MIKIVIDLENGLVFPDLKVEGFITNLLEIKEDKTIVIGSDLIFTGIRSYIKEGKLDNSNFKFFYLDEEIVVNDKGKINWILFSIPLVKNKFLLKLLKREVVNG